MTGMFATMGVRIDGTDPWDIRVHDDRFYRRVLLGGSLGLGESYMDGWWDCDDLGTLFRRVIAGRRACGDVALVDWPRRLAGVQRRLFNLQNVARSSDVVEAHYDLPVPLFEAMLGRTMAYTCAYWKDAKTLDEAQEHKLDLICRKLQVTSADTILELGCGFGSFARYAAGAYGCSVVGVNMSSEQVGYARAFCSGLPVEIHRCDYRDLGAYAKMRQFDKIVSIGMFEAIGRKNYRSHMQIVHGLLKSGGLWLLHTVGDETCSADPWVTRHIFPNGELPTLGQIAHAIRGFFELEDIHNFGLDYSQTLTRWQDNFVERWHGLRRGLEDIFDDRFFRKWIYFLGCSRGSFEARNVHLWQIVMSKDRGNLVYRSIR
jgi:cyclopropane-fatty-acyl-phospholipid synthase